jgi:transcriptional regulator with XRE-family HTH domain
MHQRTYSFTGDHGNRIAFGRLDLGLTQNQVASYAGISRRTLQTIESGGRVRPENVVRVVTVIESLRALQHEDDLIGIRDLRTRLAMVEQQLDELTATNDTASQPGQLSLTGEEVADGDFAAV